MKFLLHSPDGEGVGIAWRLREEGHKVEIFCKSKVYDGLLPKVATLDEGLSHKPDTIIFDMTGQGELADSLRKKGNAVVGGSKFMDLIELDRMLSFRLCEQLGLRVPPYHPFGADAIEDAIALVQETGKRYVLKPNGNMGLALTYVSKGPDDMIQELQWIQEEGLMKEDFTLQEFVKGVEISTECWYSKGRYFGRPNGTLEQKKFMVGDLGPNTGCQSSAVWAYPEGARIVEETIGKLDKILKGVEYTGPLDVNAIISEEDGEPYFLEFTPRFGYSAIYGLIEILDQDLGKLLYECATGEAKDVRMTDELGLVLTLSMPPFPLEVADKETGKELYGEIEGHRIFNEPSDGFYPHDVMSDDENGLQVAGTTGLVCFLGDSGMDLGQLRASVYKMAEEIEFSDKMYRTDADARVKKEFPLLEELGYEIPEGVAFEDEKEEIPV